MPGTRKLGRPTASRMAMLRAMVTFLLEKGRIETTVTRAKEVRSMTEKMITIAKNPTLACFFYFIVLFRLSILMLEILLW